MISPEQVARALALVNEGWSQRYAARTLELLETTVRRAARRYRETSLNIRGQESGRPRATSLLDRFLVMNMLSNRNFSASQTAQTLNRFR